MATDPIEGAALRQMIGLASKQSLSFAYCLGAKKDDILLIDKRKPPAALGKEARAAAGSPKVAFGTMTTQDGVVCLTCEADLPNLPKLMRGYFKENGVNAGVQLVDDDGAALPDEDGDGAEAPDQEAEAEAEGMVEADQAEETETDTAPLPDMSAARKSWMKARKSAADDMRALVAGISQAAAESPELAGATQQVARMAQPLSTLDMKLDTLLDRLQNAASEGERKKLAAAARKQVREHTAVMNSDFFKTVDDSGFANTSIRSTVLRGLRQVNEVLKQVA